MCEIGHCVEQELFVLKTRRIEILVFEHFRTTDQQQMALGIGQGVRECKIWCIERSYGKCTRHE